MTLQPTDRSTPARERILAAASRLFYRDGLRATGIDRIIAESGVAKMSFYRHFPSKAELVRQFLALRHQSWMARFCKFVEARLADQGLAAIAAALADWFADADFRGCAFINAIAETGGGDGVERQAALAHKRELQDAVTGWAARLGLQDPAAIAAAAMIVIEGAIVRAQMGDGGAATMAGGLLSRLQQRDD
jgi:AcrR family transcriptional regulator